MIRHRQFLTRVITCRMFFPIFTLTRASSHNGIHFLNSSTTKKCSQPAALNPHRATAACNSWTVQLPKGFQHAPTLWCFLILLWKRVSRHSGVQCLISHPAILRSREPASRFFYFFARFGLVSPDSSVCLFGFSLGCGKLWSPLICSRMTRTNR